MQTEENKETYIPIEPFEYWDVFEPFDEHVIRRPLLYHLQHRILPEALFTNHPELNQLFEGRDRLDYFLAKSSMKCVENGFWSEDITETDAFFDYVNFFAKHISLITKAVGVKEILLLSMPSPVTVLEAHFILMCRNNNTEHSYMKKSDGSRYFTLERSGSENTVCVCEWTYDGVHRNYGEGTKVSAEKFIENVIEIAGF